MIHNLSGLSYTVKSDIKESPLMAVTPKSWHGSAIKIFTDSKEELFVTLYSIAQQCYCSSWTNKRFIRAIANVRAETYQNSDKGVFVVHAGSVADIVEDFITQPDSDDFPRPASRSIELATRFLNWWNSDALPRINAYAKKSAGQKLGLRSEVATYLNIGDPERAEHTVLAMDLISYNIRRLRSAGLPSELAVITAINLAKDSCTKDKVNFTAIVDFIKTVNVSSAFVDLVEKLKVADNE